MVQSGDTNMVSDRYFHGSDKHIVER